MTADEFLTRRFAALAAGDYAEVYRSYHPEAPFLQNFADADSYLEFAEEQLSTIQVASWRSLQQRPAERGEEHLLMMELAVDGCRQFFYELALLIETDEGWRYHSAQKLGADDFAGKPEEIDFRHFDRVTEKIRF